MRHLVAAKRVSVQGGFAKIGAAAELHSPNTHTLIMLMVRTLRGQFWIHTLLQVCDDGEAHDPTSRGSLVAGLLDQSGSGSNCIVVRYEPRCKGGRTCHTTQPLSDYDMVISILVATLSSMSCDMYAGGETTRSLGFTRIHSRP